MAFVLPYRTDIPTFLSLRRQHEAQMSPTSLKHFLVPANECPMTTTQCFLFSLLGWLFPLCSVSPEPSANRLSPPSVFISLHLRYDCPISPRQTSFQMLLYLLSLWTIPHPHPFFTQQQNELSTPLPHCFKNLQCLQITPWNQTQLLTSPETGHPPTL